MECSHQADERRPNASAGASSNVELHRGGIERLRVELSRGPLKRRVVLLANRGSLLATYRKPFDMRAEGNENGKWLGGEGFVPIRNEVKPSCDVTESASRHERGQRPDEVAEC